MMEYVFGFLVGAATMYLAYKPQFKQSDECSEEMNERLKRIEEKLYEQNRL